ncbi:PKD domain-containing protein [Pseudonocardiaceae bacterium YIM PH 21723]|nr:PKD domain-containing protein [Pseudonocardiaceae bacterium YIM PH 21723]
MTGNRIRTALSLTVVLGMVGAVLAFGDTEDTHAPGVRLRSGELWLGSGQAGQVTLVNGPAAEVSGRIEVGPPGGRIRTATMDGTAFALSSTDGAVSRIDGGTHKVTTSERRSPGATTVLAGPRDLYTVDTDRGVIDRFDPKTLAGQGSPEQIGPTGDPVLDATGRLWLTTQEHGDLMWFDAGSRHTRPAASTPGKSALAITAGRPAMVDSKRGVAELLNPDTGEMIRSARADLRPADHLAVGGSPGRSRLLIAVSNRNLLVNCDFSATDCRPAISVGQDGSELGTPVELGDIALVPDYGLGRVWLVDLAGMRVLEQRQLFDHPKRFELIARDGWAFYNDPDGELAGVFDPHGAVHPVTKYNPSQSGEGVSPAPGQGTRPGTRPGNPAEVASISLPSGAQGPASGSADVSIVVTPRAQSAVGEELGLAVRTTNPITSVSWDFGDGSTGGGTSLRHAWAQPGSYTVRATVTSRGRSLSPAAATVTVAEPQTPPQIGSVWTDPAIPIIGQRVGMHADLSGGTPDRRQWTVTGPGPTVQSTDPDFHHTFDSAGKYTITLTVSRGAAAVTRTTDVTVRTGQVTLWRDWSWMPVDYPPPVAVGSGVTALSGSQWGEHFLALKADGTVHAWGNNTNGQVSVPPGLSGVVAVSAGRDHSLALTAGGSVIFWGGGATAMPIPEEARHDVIAISAGQGFSVALTSSGAAVIWPVHKDDPEVKDLIVMPQEVRHDIVEIDAMYANTLLRKSDGTVLNWSGARVTRQADPDLGIVRIKEGLGFTRDGSLIRFPPAPTEQPQQLGIQAVAAGCNSAIQADGTVVSITDSFPPVPPGFKPFALATAAVLCYGLT